MRRLLIFCSVAITILMTYAFVSAQSRPLMLLINGDIWRMDNLTAEPFQETYWGYNYSVSVSPNGEYLVYRSLPDWLVERDLAGIIPIDYDGYPPSNIWLMDIATRTFARIATQDEAPLDDPYQFIRRTRPTWSPDNRQIAWLELEIDNERGLHLVIYDLDNNTTTRYHNNLSGAWGDAGFVTIPNLSWGEALTYSGASSGGAGRSLTILDNPDTIIERVVANFNRNEIFNLQDWRWVEYDNQFYIALRYVHGWQLWDYTTDTTFDISSEPTLQTQSGEGLRLNYDATDRQWTILETNGNRVNLPERVSSVTLSPDGSTVVYVRWDYGENDIISHFEYWQDGNITSLVGIEVFGTGNQVIWDNTVWRVEGTISQLPELTPIPTSTPAG